MSEQLKQIQTKVIEFATSTSSKVIEAYQNNPTKIGPMIGVPLVGFAATIGTMSMFHTEKDAPAITCEISKEWQKTRKNSQERFGNKVNPDIEQSPSEKNIKIPSNSKVEFISNPKSVTKENTNQNSEKVIGTITANELQAIVGDKLDLKPETKNDIPALTNIFNKVLNVVDKEKLLANNEQMDLYLWFLKQYPTLVVIKGKINPNNLAAFVEKFNFEAERLRNVGFVELEKNGCAPKSLGKIVNTGNTQKDFDNNFATVSKLLDLEQADRKNNPVNKKLFEVESNIANQRKLIEEQIARERDVAKRANKLNGYEKSESYQALNAQLSKLNKDFDKDFVLNLPKARKPNISESEEIARKVLTLSNLLDPNNSLDESKLVRLYDRVNSYFAYSHSNNDKLKNSNEFKADLKMLTAEVVAIDNEIRFNKSSSEIANRALTGAAAAGLLSLAGLAFFALRDRRRQNQANGPIQKTDEWRRVEEARLAAEEKARRNKLILIGRDENEVNVYIPNENLVPIAEEPAHDLRKLVKAWEDINTDATDDIVEDYIENNAERIGVITLRTFEELDRELGSVVEQINTKISSNTKEQLKYEIQQISSNYG
jgi:hypothetical protein